MFDARQYISTSVAVRLSDLKTAVEYSAEAEYNTHVVRLRSGIFLVTTEDAATREAELGGRLIAIKGERVALDDIFACPDCKSHMVKIGIDIYRCTNCGETFTARGSLKIQKAGHFLVRRLANGEKTFNSR